LGYKSIRQSTIPTQNDFGTIMSADVGWQKLDAAQQGLKIRANTNRDLDARSVGGLIDYTNNQGQGKLEVRHNEIDHSTQYSGELDTRIIHTDEKWALGYSTRGNTGILVNIESPDLEKASRFEVRVNNHIEKIIEVNKPTPIFLNAFESYKVQIKNMSPESFYFYDEKPRKVTLYRGNFAALTWKARQKIVLFTQIVLPDKAPVENALVKNKAVDFNSTDEEGYLQIEVFDDTKQLEFITADQSCLVRLPSNLKARMKEGLVEVEQLICVPQKKQKTTAESASESSASETSN